MGPASLRLLLIEDNAADALLIEEALGNASDTAFVVEHVERLREAEKRLRSTSFDAILLDLGLPDSRGLEALTSILALARGASVLVLTAKDDEEAAMKALAAGAADYLVKGQVARSLLSRTVRHAIERDRAAAQARNAREEIELQARLLAAVGEAVIATDLEGRVLYWNSAAESLYGWTKEEATGQKILDLTPARDTRGDAEEVMERLGRGEGWSGEFLVRRKDDTRFAAQVGLSPLRNEEGVVFGIVGISSDLTERKALEEQLRLSQRMEAVGRLAGGIAHDFNNVITVIQGNAQLLLSELGDEALRRHVDEIGDASRRAANLTRQLLAFSRQQVLRPKVLDLGAVVGEMQEMLQRLIGTHVELRISGGPGLGSVEADPTQIGQVVMNLAVNSRDAMPGGGQLSIHLENAELDPSLGEGLPYDVTPGPYVLLRVADTGTGMDAETLSRIFEPFFTTKSVEKGTGLGLPTVYGIVKQSGGYVWVDSEPGVGTTFRIYFPRVEAAPDVEAAARSPAVESVALDRTILLCEDEGPVRSVARRVLERAGFRVLESESGEQALEVASSFPGTIDLLLSDVVMPKMIGGDLIDALREQRPGIRALLMSGYAKREVSEGDGTDPDIPFLEKPFTPDELVRKVGEVLTSEAPLAPPARPDAPAPAT